MNLLESIENHTGLYSLQEASYYANMSIGRMRYWFLGDKLHHPLRVPKIDSNGTAFITFHEFLEAVAIKNLRDMSRGLPQTFSLQKIRSAIKVAQEKFQIEIPFADSRHQIAYDDKELFVFLAGENDPTQLTGKHIGQMGIHSIETDYLNFINFDNTTNLAYEFIVGEYFDRQIVMNPRVMFGEPAVRNTPCSAPDLWSAVKAEGDMAKVSELYSVDFDSVRASCEYCKVIGYAA